MIVMSMLNTKFDNCSEPDPYLDLSEEQRAKYGQLHFQLEEGEFKTELETARDAWREQSQQFYEKNYGRISAEVLLEWLKDDKMRKVFVSLEDAIEAEMAGQEQYLRDEFLEPINEKIHAEVCRRLQAEREDPEYAYLPHDPEGDIEYEWKIEREEQIQEMSGELGEKASLDLINQALEALHDGYTAYSDEESKLLAILRILRQREVARKREGAAHEGH
jgi:hypothetical protein